MACGLPAELQSVGQGFLVRTHEASKMLWRHEQRVSIGRSTAEIAKYSVKGTIYTLTNRSPSSESIVAEPQCIRGSILDQEEAGDVVVSASKAHGFGRPTRRDVDDAPVSSGRSTVARLARGIIGCTSSTGRTCSVERSVSTERFDFARDRRVQQLGTRVRRVFACGSTGA
jgi:hypothetical protein